MPTLKSRAKRVAVATVAATLTISGLAGCRIGFEAPTLMQYTPAEGINLDVTDGSEVEQGTGEVKVRNLMVVADPESGEGILAGALFASDSITQENPTESSDVIDSLDEVTGRALDSRGTPQGDLQVELGDPLDITMAQPLLLEDEDISVSGDGLRPGLDVELTLTFGENGEFTTAVPVIDASKPDFATMEAVPAGGEGEASPSASPSPEGEGTEGEGTQTDGTEGDTTGTEGTGTEDTGTEGTGTEGN